MTKLKVVMICFLFLCITSSGYAADEKAKVSPGDTTEGFLMDKLQAGPDIELTESGTSNRVIIIGRKPVLTEKGDVLTHNDNKEVRLEVGSNNEVLTADSSTSNGIKWAPVPNGKDDADGVEIMFTREFQYDPGTGNVPAIDINGTALVINQTDPTVTLGGQARSVLATTDIPNTTPQLQQVIVDLPSSLLAGNYKLKLSNSQGNSETVIPLNEIIAPIGGNDSFTKLLFHGDGAGAIFTDSSASEHTITVVGNAIQSATESQFGGKSIQFDGDDDYLTIPDSEDWSFGNGDFTVDAWVNFSAHPASNGNVLAIAGQFSGLQKSWRLGYYNNAGTYRLWWNTSTNGSNETDFKPAWTATLNNWHHIAVTRTSGTVRAFIDGVEIGSQADSDTYHSANSDLFIGIDQVVSGYEMNGFIDELRISKGIARWTEDFTPPALPYN